MDDTTAVYKGVSKLLGLLDRILNHVAVRGNITIEELRRIMVEEGYERNKGGNSIV